MTEAFLYRIKAHPLEGCPWNDDRYGLAQNSMQVKRPAYYMEKPLRATARWTTLQHVFWKAGELLCLLYSVVS